MTKILGICGSLRKASFNRSALRAAQGLLPAGAALEIYDLDGIPVFNQDDEQSPPASVVAFKDKIRASDAILFATPEYNFSIPGVLKNAIDWASRPSGQSAWKGKPVAVMGASGGMLGTARAQYHLRQCFVTLDMPAVTLPEVLIGQAAQKFNAQGELTDQPAKDLMARLLVNLVEHAQRYKAKS